MDEDVDVSLEDGEIVDDDCVYTPLERPPNYALMQPNTRFPALQPESDSEQDNKQTTSESDSDYDTSYRQKRPKMKAKLGKPLQPTTKKPSKYNIWSTHIQEDVLADTLNTCDVTKKDRSRSVESYDYSLARKQRFNNKRTRGERNNKDLRLVKQSSAEKPGMKGSTRLILDLTVTCDNTEEEIAKDMANKLFEEKEDLIHTIVKVAGKEKAIKIFKEVKRIEQEGGMLIMNQSRRRTPGGVYFFLIKHDSDLTPDQQSKIFEEEKQKSKSEVKAKQKKKFHKMKLQIDAKKSLPELLTIAEELLVTENDRSRRKTGNSDVTNPPPTPETDCHENSGDGIDQPSDGGSDPPSTKRLEPYETDFLDLGTAADMDLF